MKGICKSDCTVKSLDNKIYNEKYNIEDIFLRSLVIPFNFIYKLL